MPLLTVSELESKSALFKGKTGNALARSFMHILSVDRVNDLYDRFRGYEGPYFTSAVLEELGIRYEVGNSSVLDSLPDGPFITISNHPYGHIDGVILIDLFGHLRSDYKVMVNGFLGRIEPLKDNFISVTPVGNAPSVPDKDSIIGVKHAFLHVRSGHPLGLFPSGAVSDFSLKDRTVRDREWQDPVIRLIKKLHVPVLPLKFMDRNSDFYYSLGLLDWRVRLLRLPAEVFNKKDAPVRLVLGEMISPERQDEFNDIDSFKEYLRSSVYRLNY